MSNSLKPEVQSVLNQQHIATYFQMINSLKTCILYRKPSINEPREIKYNKTT